MGKKLLVFLMILSLLGSCVSVLADDAVTVYTSLISARILTDGTAVERSLPGPPKAR
jgi:hypothetical protein